MVLVYDMSSGERLDAVPGERVAESRPSDAERPVVREPEVAPALQEVVQTPGRESVAPQAAFHIARLLEEMS